MVCNKEGLDAPDRSSGRSEVTCKARNGQAAAKSKTADAAHHNDTLFPTSSRSEAAVSMSPAPSLTTKVKDDAGHNLDGSDFEKAVFVEILGKKAEWSRKEDTTAIFLGESSHPDFLVSNVPFASVTIPLAPGWAWEIMRSMGSHRQRTSWVVSWSFPSWDCSLCARQGIEYLPSCSNLSLIVAVQGF